MSNQARAVTDLKYYKNLTKTGRSTSTRARRGLHYYTFGRDESMNRLKEDERGLRGDWVDQRGVEVNVPEMQKWVKVGTRENKYTYTAILSLRDGDMGVADFVQAMNEGIKQTGEFTGYRLIMHDDTEHRHAHVIAFRDTKIKKPELELWKQAVKPVLSELELQRLQESQQRQLEREMAQPLFDEFDHVRLDENAALQKQQEADEQLKTARPRKDLDMGLG